MADDAATTTHPPTRADRVREGLRHPVLLVLLAWVVTQCCLVLSGPLAVRLLGVEGRGEVALAVAVLLLCTQVGLLGLPAALTFYGSDGSVPVWSILRSIAGSIRLQVAATAVAAVCLLVVVTHVGAGSPASPVLAVVIGIGAGTVVLARLAISGLQAEHRLRAFALAQPLPAVVYSGGLVVLVLADVPDVELVVALFVTGWVTATAAAGLLLRRTAPRTDPDDLAERLPDRRAVLRFGRRAAVASASPTDQFGVDQLLVGSLLGHVALGLYAIGLAFQSVSLLPLYFLGTFVGPRVAAAAPAERLATARRWLSLGLGLGLSVGLVVQLLIPFVLPLAFGSGATGATTAAHLLAAAGTLLGQRNLNATALQALGAPGATTRIEATSFVVMVLGVVVLGGAYGVEGATLGLVAAALVANVLQLLALRRVARAGVTTPEREAPLAG